MYLSAESVPRCWELEAGAVARTLRVGLRVVSWSCRPRREQETAAGIVVLAVSKERQAPARTKLLNS